MLFYVTRVAKKGNVWAPMLGRDNELNVARAVNAPAQMQRMMHAAIPSCFVPLK